MTNTLKCISPVDGSVYAERPLLGTSDAARAVAEMTVAQVAWAERPLAERIALVRKGVANVGAMNDEIVTELAWQMGRPIRYGGEFSGFEERLLHGRHCRGSTCADHDRGQR